MQNTLQNILVLVQGLPKTLRPCLFKVPALVCHQTISRQAPWCPSQSLTSGQV